MKMKNITIYLITILLLVSLYFNFVMYKNNGHDLTDFERRSQCQSLQTEVENRLKEKYGEPLYREVSLDKIFYSSVSDSCLYSYRVWGNSENDRPSFYLYDALTNSEVYSVITPDNVDIIEFGKYLDSFNEKVETYSN